VNATKPWGKQGFHIAFLVFAVVFLNAPLDKYVYSTWQWARDLQLPLGRPLMIIMGGLLLVAIAPIRRACSDMLAPRIPTGKRREVALALAIELTASMGALGGFALWNYMKGAEPALARAMGEHPTHAAQLEQAFSVGNLILFLFIAGLVAPIVEELVFRGLLYRSWREAWGWVWGALASSFVFGLFHGLVWPQFLAGIVFVVAVRRTATIRAAIYAHALSNLLLWYPLAGQFMMPSGRATGELQVWWPHLACLAATVIILPWYMWTARDARLPRQSEFAEARIA
jgi:membrane protease YdiL (CAAX protease family)